MNLQELKKMAESVNALSIKVYPILDDGTKKKVKEQGTGYCWRCHKDIKKSIDTLKEAKKEKKEKKETPKKESKAKAKEKPSTKKEDKKAKNKKKKTSKEED